jgi:methionyl-tRNA formyltransferase
MVKVLVIIDNIIQYQKIKNLIFNNNYGASFTFKHSDVKSDIWDHEDFKDKSDSIIDVNQSVNEILSKYNLVLSIHCFQFFPKELVENVRCINIHPGYNPINRGWYPQVFSIINDLPIGATIHEMDKKLDNGPIIDRAFVNKYAWDTSLTLYKRVLDKEMQLLEENFDVIIKGNYERILPENEGNMFKKKDFKDLCELNLDEQLSMSSYSW